ncbi:MAG: beta-ketoacyl-ACP synthase II [Candidatus Omnitrophica bacterium]|nr:beta-ketoacyl-ACP synthase II [Candidatus Omnitrophota bacterium]MCM8808850.1 beta-ketoacyl-ACP synthase II [Candidatus Omnitrophota bacterium]MCM8810389.1 beta-ketoacyl-ACP synthase II [Candidatus Omnitrophota bacterium]MCM8832358.1 beta-ketoacyl-ACP synthase II [Candidatus Omnitrophota bacterium]
MKRVVVTGLGLVTSIGNDVKTTWENLINGISGVDKIKSFDVSSYETQIGAEVKNFNLENIHPKEKRKMDTFVQFAIKATDEAIKDSGLEFSEEEKNNVGVIIGAGIGGLRIIEQQHKILLEQGPNRVSPFLIPMLIPDIASGHIAILYGFKGVNFCTVSACASGAHALAISLNLIRSGVADVIISGGTESCITPLGLAGFCSMKALSRRNNEPQKASRPFDKERDGFVMGEGAGVVILESLEHAKKRNANIYCEFVGAGMSCDAYHITAPDTDGYGAYLSMKYALLDAKVNPDDVDYINAHGTSTPLNDKSETLAIKKLFGQNAYKIPISSIKSMIGHTLGAAGAIEFISTCLTLKTNIIPPTINYEYPDPECDLDYVPNVAREKEVKVAISNSFGFGGHNVTLVIKKFNE